MTHQTDLEEFKRDPGPTRRQWVLMFALLGGLIAIGLYSRFSGASIPDNDIDWRHDFAAAAAEARASDRPMLLYFTADWCQPCQRMKRKVWPEARVADAVNNKTIPVYLDVDQPAVKELAKYYPSRSVPTLLMTDPTGVPLLVNDFMLGHDRYTSADHIVSLVESVEDATPIPDDEFVRPKLEATDDQPAPDEPSQAEGGSS